MNRSKGDCQHTTEKLAAVTSVAINVVSTPTSSDSYRTGLVSYQQSPGVQVVSRSVLNEIEVQARGRYTEKNFRRTQNEAHARLIATAAVIDPETARLLEPYRAQITPEGDISVVNPTRQALEWDTPTIWKKS